MLVSNTGVYILARGNDGISLFSIFIEPNFSRRSFHTFASSVLKKNSKLYTFSFANTGELRLLSGTWKCSDLAVSANVTCSSRVFVDAHPETNEN